MGELIYKIDMEEGVAVLTLILDNVTMHENEEKAVDSFTKKK